MSLVLKMLLVGVTALVGWLLAALQFRPQWRDGRTTIGKKGRNVLFLLLPVILIASLATTWVEHRVAAGNLRTETDKRAELADSLRIARAKLAELQEDFQASQRSPQFQPFVNDLAISDFSDISFQTSLGERIVRQASVVIPTTNEQQKITLTVRNTGNLPADKLSVVVRLPNELPLTTGSAWRPVGYVNRTHGGTKPDSTRPAFFIDSHHVIDPGAYFSCDRLTIDADAQQTRVVPMDVEVSSLHSEKHRFNIVLVFVPGIGKPFVTALKK